jgi:hypothetical protein
MRFDKVFGAKVFSVQGIGHGWRNSGPSKAGRKRTRTYTDDVQQVSRAILAEISISAPGDDLQPISGISLRRIGDTQLLAELPGGESVVIWLATTATQFSGVRWWYVCPECKTRRSALFLSGLSFCRRQCVGIHYASQSKRR